MTYVWYVHCLLCSVKLTEHSGMAACHRYGMCTVCCVECVALNTVVWQHVIGMVCVLFAVLSVLH